MSQSWQKISAVCRILSSMSLGKRRRLTKTQKINEKYETFRMRI